MTNRLYCRLGRIPLWIGWPVLIFGPLATVENLTLISRVCYSFSAVAFALLCFRHVHDCRCCVPWPELPDPSATWILGLAGILAMEAAGLHAMFALAPWWQLKMVVVAAAVAVGHSVDRQVWRLREMRIEHAEKCF